MQQINFGALDFSRIPQQEDEARRRQYQAMSDLASGLGQGIAKGADMWQNAYQQELAENWRRQQFAYQKEQQELADNWRQQQFAYQRGRDETADARYAAELAAKNAERQSSIASAEKLRQDFLTRFGDQDLSKYGPGAQFALARIQNARDWNDIVGAGESLANIMQYRDALDTQQSERAAANAEQERQMAGPRLSQQIGSSMAASGLDLGNLNDVYSSTPRLQRQPTLDQLKAYRDQLVQFQIDNPGMLTPDMQKQLNDLNNAIRVWGRKMRARPTRF